MNVFGGGKGGYVPWEGLLGDRALYECVVFRVIVFGMSVFQMIICWAIMF